MNTDFEIFLDFIRNFYYLIYNPETSIIAISDNKNPSDNSDIIEITDIRGVRVLFVWDSGRMYTDFSIYHSQNYTVVHNWIEKTFKNKEVIQFYEDCIITNVPFKIHIQECDKVFGII